MFNYAMKPKMHNPATLRGLYIYMIQWSIYDTELLEFVLLQNMSSGDITKSDP